MKARIKWVEGMSFAGQGESGHSVIMDGPPDSGGENRGLRPMELVLIGMGGCTAFDVMYILKKARQAVTDCVVELSAERAGEVPKVFARIHAHYIITGKGLKPEQVERAVTLSAEKYCSATIMLGKTAAITHDFVVVEA